MRRFTRRTCSIMVTIAACWISAAGPLGAQDSTAAVDRETAVRDATAAAESWLALLDEGAYAATWERAASAFRAAVTKAQWEQAVRQARSGLEPLGARSRVRAEYTTQLPQAPPGEYVLIQYRTEASRNRTVTETVVPMRDTDGVWRVSGYFVRPG